MRPTMRPCLRRLVAARCTPPRRAYSDQILLPGSRGPIIANMQGAGGRSTRANVTATVFGCTGFLGRGVANQLAQLGYQLVLPWSGDENKTRSLRQFGDLGQLTFPKFSIYDRDSLFGCVRHSDIVFNFIGDESDRIDYSMEQSNAHAAENIAFAVSAAKQELGDAPPPHLVYMSHISASPDSQSAYLRAKHDAELRTRKHAPWATIVRCSSLYGESDKFLLRFNLLRKAFFMYPLFAGGERILRPLFVGDAARALTYIALDPSSPSTDYEFFNPQPITERQAAETFLFATIRPQAFMRPPKFISKALLRVLSVFLPNVFNADTMARLEIDETPSGRPGLRFLADAGVPDPIPFEEGITPFVRHMRERDERYLPIRDEPILPNLSKGANDASGRKY